MRKSEEIEDSALGERVTGFAVKGVGADKGKDPGPCVASMRKACGNLMVRSGTESPFQAYGQGLPDL